MFFVNLDMAVSTEHATPRNPPNPETRFLGTIQIKQKSQFEFVLRVPGNMSFWMWWIFGGVTISEETVEFLF